MTAASQSVVHENAQQSNPVIESLDPSVFEVPAKKQSLMWQSQQYRDQGQRGNLNVTSSRGTPQLDVTSSRGTQNNIDPEIMERLRETKHNIKVTNISEYSNALNRGRVFTNPKFSSC